MSPSHAVLPTPAPPPRRCGGFARCRTRMDGLWSTDWGGWAGGRSPPPTLVVPGFCAHGARRWIVKAPPLRTMGSPTDTTRPPPHLPARRRGALLSFALVRLVLSGPVAHLLENSSVTRERRPPGAAHDAGVPLWDEIPGTAAPLQRRTGLAERLVGGELGGNWKWERGCGSMRQSRKARSMGSASQTDTYRGRCRVRAVVTPARDCLAAP